MQSQTDFIAKMHELIQQIMEADEAYYVHDTEIMSNLKYDALCDQLKALETETGITLANSPSIRVAGRAAQGFEKKKHETPMLSLDKTKDRDVLQKWVEKHMGRDVVLSYKLDGLTIVCTYEDGILKEAVTRGTNGIVGEVITENARRFVNLPMTIPYKDRLVIRGEAIITYRDFDAVNARIPDIGDRYKNPRNLASGSVRQLDPYVTAARRVRFMPFELVSGCPLVNSYAKRLDFLKELGFQPVTYIIVTSQSLQGGISYFEKTVPDYPIPTDGLVLALDDTAYARTLGTTSKHPLSAIAFKWQDDTMETTLRGIEWSASRTGRINPVAVFDPVELEDTTVERASLHNLTIMDELAIGKNDIVSVYKANKIIPQIAENITRSNNWRNTMYCHVCPVCGQPTAEHESADGMKKTVTLYCENPACPAKTITHLDHMASQNGLDIRGMSESMIESLLDSHILSDYASLFHMADWRENIAMLPGFGEITADNLIKAAEKARSTTPARLLYGLGINGIGHSQSKNITAVYSDPKAYHTLEVKDLSSINGIGEIKAAAFVNWFKDSVNLQEYQDLLKELDIQAEESSDTSSSNELAGNTYVITGKLVRIPNRKELVALVEKHGGKVSDSVSAKTTALVNNDIASQSGKNKKAKELGIPIITENDILKQIGYPIYTEEQFEKLL